MSMFNDIDWKKNDENCISNAEKVKNYAVKFSKRHWTFLGQGRKKSGIEVLLTLQYGKWNSLPSKMVQRFKETRSSCVQKYQCLESWNLEAEKR